MTIFAFALGLLAWGLGVEALLNRRAPRKSALCSAGSFAACAASLCLVVVDLAGQADEGDVSAILDTVGGFRLCAVVLLIGTLALNALALFPHPRTK